MRPNLICTHDVLDLRNVEMLRPCSITNVRRVLNIRQILLEFFISLAVCLLITNAVVHHQYEAKIFSADTAFILVYSTYNNCNV